MRYKNEIETWSSKQTTNQLQIILLPFMSMMSLFGTRREDFWQTTSRSTIKERCEAIFNQEFLSDIKFVVRDSQGGSESKKIPAHKFVLAISSPVFYAMFYGELAETKDSVEISDCEYESLLELFRFIYSDEANLTPDNVMQLMYLAKKYMLPSLADKCSAYLQKNLDASNVFTVFPDAQKYEEKDLLDYCWKVIEKETEEAVKSDGFVTIGRSVLEEMVEKDSLAIKEVELFKAVDHWAGKECEKQGLEAEGSVKRRILGERIVKGIRFPVMEEKEFADVVLDCGILTSQECFNVVKYFYSVLKIPVGFPEAKRTGILLERVSRFKSVVCGDGWHHSSKYYDKICLSVDKDIRLHAVRLFGSDSRQYSVILTVKNILDVALTEIKENNILSRDVLCETGNYKGFDVVFKPPIALKKHSRYSFEVDITGPPSWYGENGQASVEHSGVNFSFVNKSREYTCVQRGQFAEWLFTVD